MSDLKTKVGAVRERVGAEVDRVREKADTDHSGSVSASEAKQFVEAETAKRPLRAIAISAGLGALGLGLVYVLYLVVR